MDDVMNYMKFRLKLQLLPPEISLTMENRISI